MQNERVVKCLEFVKFLTVGLGVLIFGGYICGVGVLAAGIEQMETWRPNPFYKKGRYMMEARWWWVPVLLALCPVFQLAVLLGKPTMRWAQWIQEESPFPETLKDA